MSYYRSFHGIMKCLKKQARENFTTAVGTYAQWAEVQKASAQDLVSLLPRKGYSNILDCGCGTGFVIEFLSRWVPVSRLTGIDIAPGMVAHCAQHWPQYTFYCQDMEAFAPTEKFDLILSNFAFQWLTSISLFVKKAVSMLASRGVFAFSVPVEGSLGELIEAGIIANHNKPPLHAFPALTLFDETVHAIKEVQYFSRLHDYCTYYTSALEALHSLKKIGASYFSEKRYSYGEMKKMLRQYEDSYRNSEGFYPLTYKVLTVFISK